MNKLLLGVVMMSALAMGCAHKPVVVAEQTPQVTQPMHKVSPVFVADDSLRGTCRGWPGAKWCGRFCCSPVSTCLSTCVATATSDRCAMVATNAPTPTTGASNSSRSSPLPPGSPLLAPAGDDEPSRFRSPDFCHRLAMPASDCESPRSQLGNTPSPVA
jgi:hypothetical protein